jgi:catechol 2,3-dioxygenase-like lactoylglutathione lyase family enzyme
MTTATITDMFFKPHKTTPPTLRWQLDKFNEWFSRCHNALQHIANQILGDYLMAEHALQNCWFRASRNPQKLENEGAFRSWVVRLLISEALSILHQTRVVADEEDLPAFRKEVRQNCKQENKIVTQTVNALHAALSDGKESLAKNTSMRKQVGRRNTGIHHVGLHVKNPLASAEFYRDALGMEIVGGSLSDHPLGATAFLCSRPDEESHEIGLFANPDFAHIAFKVSSLAELRYFYARVVEKNIPIKFVFNHRVSFAFYFDDPDGNMIEVYWPTGDLSCRQPCAEPLDLSQSDDVLLEMITTTL